LANSINAKNRHSWQFGRLTAESYHKRLQENNRSILSQCISLAESQNLKDKIIISDLLNLSQSSWVDNRTLRIGITGPPGVGKSTFIDGLGLSEAQKPEKKLAVLAIDPTSIVTKGSILGDKTRMFGLTQKENVYIRPNPSREQLGGLTLETATSILLCEAAGYCKTYIESVGVGQSEIEIDMMTDIVILLIQPGSGDTLQGIKKGIMEVADIIVIHKLDGSTEHLGKEMLNQFKSLYPHTPIIGHSSHPTVNADSLLEIETAIAKISTSLIEKRKVQNHYLINAELKSALLDHAESEDLYNKIGDTNSIQHPTEAYVKLREALKKSQI